MPIFYVFLYHLCQCSQYYQINLIYKIRNRYIYFENCGIPRITCIFSGNCSGCI